MLNGNILLNNNLLRYVCVYSLKTKKLKIEPSLEEKYILTSLFVIFFFVLKSCWREWNNDPEKLDLGIDNDII